MNKEISRYQGELKKHMHCAVSTKQKLIMQFNDSLSSFLEDQPDPTYEQLIGAFGPPQEMASILMESLSEKQKAHYRFVQKAKKIIVAVLAALFILFSAYVFWEKEFSVITIEGELIPGLSTIVDEE